MNPKTASLKSVLWRLTLVAGVIATAVAAIGEIHLRLQCDEHLELNAETLADQTSIEPVWANVSGFVAAAPPVLVASETGKARGAYLPLAAPDAPATVVAVLATESMGEARELFNRHTGLALDGLYTFPTLRKRQFLNRIFRESGLEARRAVRILEPGREPMRVLSLLGLVALALVMTFLLVRSTPHPREWAAAAWIEQARARASDRAIDFNLRIPPRVQVHTTDDEVDDFERKVLVEDMLEGVWDDVERTVRRANV